MASHPTDRAAPGPQHHLQLEKTGSYLTVARRPTPCRPAGRHMTRTADLGPDNDRVTSSALRQLAVVVAVTVVVMLLVIWRRR